MKQPFQYDVPFILPQGDWSSYQTLIEAEEEILFPNPGQLVYIIGEDKFYYYKNPPGAWTQLSSGGTGGGDMYKSVYDKNNDNIVDDAEAVIVPIGVADVGGISGGRAVIVEGGIVKYFDNTDLNHYGRCVGITTGAASEGSLVYVVSDGYVKGLSLTPYSTYYALTNGIISTTVPTSGLLQVVGTAINSTDLHVRIETTVELI